MSSSDLSGTLSIEIEVKSSAQAFYEAHVKKVNEIPKLCPSCITKVELVEGKWEEEGAVMNWYLLYEGKEVVSQEAFENIDDEKLTVTFRVIGGELLAQAYKKFNLIFLAIPKKEGCLIRWTLEYEKLNADIPEPKEMMQFAVKLTEEIDANLIIMSQK